MSFFRCLSCGFQIHDEGDRYVIYKTCPKCGGDLISVRMSDHRLMVEKCAEAMGEGVCEKCGKDVDYLYLITGDYLCYDCYMSMKCKYCGFHGPLVKMVKHLIEIHKDEFFEFVIKKFVGGVNLDRMYKNKDNKL